MRRQVAARRPERAGPVGVKRLRGTRKPMSARVVGTGPRVAADRRRPRTGQARMTPLLKRLKSEVGEMRDQGNALTKQMWLLYSTFEDFIKVKHPEQARKFRKNKKVESDDDHEWLKKSGIRVINRDDDTESETSIEQARTDVPEQDFDLTITKIPICEMDPVIMSDLELSAAETTPKRSPEKRAKDRLSIGDSNHRSSKKAKRSAAKKDIVVDKVVAPDAEADPNKSTELFPWPLSVEHKKALEASGLSVVRDSLHTSSTSSEAESSTGEIRDPSGTEGSPAESTSSSVTRPRAASPIISSGYESEIKEEEIDDMFHGSPGKEQQAPVVRRDKKPSPNKASGDDLEPIYENIDFVETCTRASAESKCHDSSCTTEQLQTSKDSIIHTTVNESSIVNIDNKGLNLIKFGQAIGFIFPDPRSPAATSNQSVKSNSGSRLQRSMSADNLSFEKEEEFIRDSPVYENLPRTLRGQVSPPRRFTMTAGAGNATLTLPKPQPKHSSTPFRINFDTLSIQDVSLGATSMNSTLTEDSHLDLTLGVTPRMSAFRPYNGNKEQPIFTDCLRTQNFSPSYICMSRRQRREATRGVSKKLFSTPSQTPARALDLTEAGYATSKMVSRRFQTIEQDLTYDRAPPSIDSGRGGSVSPADDSNGPVKMASILSDRTIDLTTVTEPENDTEPIYESIADCTLYSRVGDTKPDVSISLSEHTYDKIDDITASTLVESPQPPELPPARVSSGTLPQTGQSSQALNQTYAKASPKPKMGQGIKPDKRKSEVIDQNRYHKYTVDDVLESVERLAGHLPAAKNRGNIYSLISDRRTRRQISKSLANEKPPQKGPLKADHSQTVLRDRRNSPKPFDRWTKEGNKENDVYGGIAINRLPRYASIRKTTSFVDLSPNTRVSVPRDTQSLSRMVGSNGEKFSAMPSRPLSMATRTKVLTQSNHHYQNLQEFTSGKSIRSRPKSEVIEPEKQSTFRRTRSALQLHWKNGTLNEIWC